MPERIVETRSRKLRVLQAEQGAGSRDGSEATGAHRATALPPRAPGPSGSPTGSG